MVGVYLSAIVLLLSVFLLFSSKHTQKTFLIVSALCILIYKLIEYTQYGLLLQPYKIPLEYSTMAYFIYSITIIFNFSKMKALAAFASFISGFGYLISFMFLAPDFILNNGVYLTSFAFINHSILFIGSLLLMSEHHYTKYDNKLILNYTLFYVVYVVIINHIVEFPQSYIFIRLLLGGNFLNYIYPSISYTSYDYLLYFILLLITYKFSLHLFNYINHLIFFLRKDNRHEYTI